MGKLFVEGDGELKVGKLFVEGDGELKVGKLFVEGDGDYLQPENLQPSTLNATPEVLRPYNSDVVLELLAEVSQWIQKAKQLEQKSCELEAAMAQLQSEIAERQRVEAALRDSETELRALFEAMTDVVFVIDQQGRYLKIPSTNPTLLYKRADELIGKTLHEVFGRSQADTFVSYIRQVLDTQQTVNVEYSCPTIGQQEVWFAASISPISQDLVIWVARDITERKQTEKRLQLLERAIAASSNGIVITDATWPNNPIIYVNPGFERITGYSAQEVIGKNSRLLQRGDKRQPALDSVRTALREQRDCFVTVRNYRKDGTLFWNELSISPMRDETGRLTHYVGVQTDITERKIAEAALQRQLVAVEAAMDGIAMLNAQGEYIYMNDAHVKLFGYGSSSELLGKTWHELYYPDEIYRIEQDIFLILSQNRQWRGEAIGKKRDGSTFFQEVSLTLTEDGGIICVCRNITQRKQAERALRESEEKYRLLFECELDAISLFDVETGEFLDVNNSFLELYGYSTEEALKLTPALVSAEPETTKAIIKFASSTGNAHILRRWHKKKDGTVFPVELCAGTFIWKGRKVMCAVVRDITERKRMEEEMQQTRNFLQTTIDHLPVAVFVKDAKEDSFGAFKLWNKTCEMMFGLTSQQAIGKTDHDFFPIEQADFFSQKDRQVFERSTVQDIPEETIDSKSLGRRILHTVKVPIYDENHSPQYLLCISEDITERKQALEALRQAEERYRSIFENSDEGIFQTTTDGSYLSANPALAKIYGYSSPEELIATLTDINQQLYVDSNRRAQFLAILRSLDRVSNFEFQVYRQDGSIIWISENAHVVRDEAGEVLYYEGSVVDITQRKVWEQALRYQQECADDLLLNILPKPIAQRLKMAESNIADSFAEVTVLFADLVNFTELSAQIAPTKLVDLLNKIFSKFDRLAQKHGLEKIKTIGDAYMVVGGLPTPRPDHAEGIADMALDMQREIARFKRENGEPFCLRIGIHTGPVVAGVIGMKKFTYDLWGDTVNVASRMESQGVAGSIQVSAATYERLQDKYLFEKRGAIAVKGKGEMITYWLAGKKVS